MFSLSSHISENHRVFLGNGRSPDGHVITDLCPFLKDIHNFDHSETVYRVQTLGHSDELVTRVGTLAERSEGK